MLIKPGHDLNEIAGQVAVIELGFENTVPGILAGAGRAGQHEDEGGVCHAAGRP